MSSKFKNILDAARSQADVATDESDMSQTPVRRDEPSLGPTPPRRRGRPPIGKRNDPDYEQVTAYIRRDIYRRVKIALLKEPRKTEFSQLVDRLLEDWVQTKE